MTLHAGPALLLLLTAPAWLGACGRDDALTVHAAASLAEVAADLAEGWEQRTGQSVRVSLAASSTLARQIARGAPADLFLSADPRWLEGLDVVERDDWLLNRLAWVVPADRSAAADVAGAGAAEVAGVGAAGAAGGASSGSVGAGLPEARPEQVVRWCAEAGALVLGDDAVPVGRYADQALAGLAATLPARLVRGAHARDVLAKVACRAGDAGVVYATDAALDPRVRAVALLPADVHEPIVYVAAALTERARALLHALNAPWMVERATARGFARAP